MPKNKKKKPELIKTAETEVIAGHSKLLITNVVLYHVCIILVQGFNLYVLSALPRIQDTRTLYLYCIYNGYFVLFVQVFPCQISLIVSI